MSIARREIAIFLIEAWIQFLREKGALELSDEGSIIIGWVCSWLSQSGDEINVVLSGLKSCKRELFRVKGQQTGVLISNIFFFCHKGEPAAVAAE